VRLDKKGLAAERIMWPNNSIQAHKVQLIANCSFSFSDLGSGFDTDVFFM